MTDFVAVLKWLKIEGDVLPAVSDGWTPADLTRRTQDEVHACLACGKRAHCTYVADTDKGDRWLDLCRPCAHTMRCELDRHDPRFDWREEQRRDRP